MKEVNEARVALWSAGLALERAWVQAQSSPLSVPGESRTVARCSRQVARKLDTLRHALTLGGTVPLPSADEARVDLMRWGVDEGLISAEQYDQWVAEDPVTRNI